MSENESGAQSSAPVTSTGDPFRRPSRRSIVVGAAWAVPAVIAVKGTPAWAASPHDFVPCPNGTFQTVGRGRFLSGSLLGTPLDTLAAIKGINVANDGSGVVTPSWWGTGTGTSPAFVPVSGDAYAYAAPLTVSAINSALNIGVAPIALNVDTPVGAVNQYGRAVQNGFSAGASGAVNNNGVIQTDNNGPAWPDLATLDLKTLVSSVSGDLGMLVGNLTDLQLVIGAVAARATLDACPTAKQPNPDRTYLVSYVKLVVETGTLGTIVGALAGALDALGLTNITDTNNIISIDGTSGALTIDLGALVANAYTKPTDPYHYPDRLNSLDPNTPLLINGTAITTLTDAVVAALTHVAGGLLGGLLDVIWTLTVKPLINGTLVPLLQNLLGGLFNTTNGVVNIVLNAQNAAWNGTTGPTDFPVVPSAYDVAALWVTVLPGVANGVNLYLARASVGPNSQL